MFNNLDCCIFLASFTSLKNGGFLSVASEQ